MTKKILIISAVVVLLFVVAYFLSRNKKKQSGSQTVPAPPPEQPATTNMVDLNSGPGLGAVNRRTLEIMKSDEWLAIQTQVQIDTDVLQGVQSGRSYYNQNLSRTTITSAKGIPLNLTNAAKAALNGFAGIVLDGTMNMVDVLRLANAELLAAAGTTMIGNPEIESSQNFAREIFCQFYEDCGKNYRYLVTKFFGAGADRVAADIKKIAANWADAVSSFESEVKAKAIADLRAAGWKFIGFDF